MIVLRSSDGETFEVEEAVAMESQMLKHMIEDNCADAAIPLSNTTSNILAKVIEYCKRHLEASKASDVEKSSEDELKKFDADFVKVDWITLLNISLAANFLNIESLLELSCQTMADVIQDKSVKQVRKMFGIQNDFTREQEEEIRRENAWAFE